MIQIKKWWNNDVLFELNEANGYQTGMKIADAVKKAIESRANLRDADLRDADLRDADLSRADLRDADLRDADLSRANLSDADLSGADLSGANLSDASLSGANLSGADLTPIRDDIWAILASAPKEVPALREALINGKVDGSNYQGRCACLVGTLANAKQCGYDSIAGLTPNSRRPAERFFMGIKQGDKPESNQFSALALEWVDQWIANMRTAGAYVVTE